MEDKACIGIIFRTPDYGKVKKRLASTIGEERALRAYTVMLYATISNVSGLDRIDIFGFYEGRFPEEISTISRFKEILPQEGQELGERLLRAIERLSKAGYKKILLIGADSPDLPADNIKEAFRALDNFDLVIGPSEDGGYYLIGMKEPLFFIFQEIPWGGSEVLKTTLRMALQKGLSVYLLPRWYDIDTEKDLKRWFSKCLNY
ncbi:MAG: TIGR04282 family arsenosugar biosynthesis glycosyltransferase [Thermodesulfovibrionales bacterium]|nr:TIGR04282 family arsenosugar biosynthesis glycosyltransferase [Thermodesulfovibrionales bacterium]